MVAERRCQTCGDPLPSYCGRGRPRVRCESCSQDKSTLGKAWRLAHPREVMVYNAARRDASAGPFVVPERQKQIERQQGRRP